MGLAALQEQLAALLMEAPQRAAFAADAPAFLRSQGLRGRDARLLASLDADDLAYFASRRHIDRQVALRAELPRSCRLLEAEGRLLWYLRDCPYAREGAVAEARQFAAWARRAARAGQVTALLPDLAAFEVEVLRLGLAAAPAAGGAGLRPAAYPMRAPRTAILHLRHPVQGARGQAVPAVAPEETFLGLVRTDGVVWHRFERVDFELLRSARGRMPESAWLAAAARAAAVPVAEARESARQLRAVGLLRPRTARGTADRRNTPALAQRPRGALRNR